MLPGRTDGRRTASCRSRANSSNDLGDEHRGKGDGGHHIGRKRERMCVRRNGSQAASSDHRRYHCRPGPHRPRSPVRKHARETYDELSTSRVASTPPVSRLEGTFDDRASSALDDDVRNPPDRGLSPCQHAVVMDDFERCYGALKSRDARFDGWFFAAVSSTGIYCRPSCPAMTPKRQNLELLPHCRLSPAGWLPGVHALQARCRTWLS